MTNESDIPRYSKVPFQNTTVDRIGLARPSDEEGPAPSFPPPEDTRFVKTEIPSDLPPIIPGGNRDRVDGSGDPAGTFSDFYEGYKLLINLLDGYDAITFHELDRQIVNDVRLPHKERALLLIQLDGKQEAEVPIPCPYCGYEDRHHSPSADCTGLEEKR